MIKISEPCCGFGISRHPTGKTGGGTFVDMLLAGLTRGGRVCFKRVLITCGMIVACVLISTPGFAVDLKKKYEFDIREATLGAALDVIVRTTGFLIIFPYELAGKT